MCLLELFKSSTQVQRQIIDPPRRPHRPIEEHIRAEARRRVMHFRHNSTEMAKYLKVTEEERIRKSLNLK